MGTINKFTLASLGILSLSILTGCDNEVGNTGGTTTPQKVVIQSTQPKTAIKGLGDGFYMVRMGSAFDMSSNTATSSQSCLVASQDQNNITITNPSTIIGFDSQQSLSSLENNLNTSSL
ncbi:MAG: hypothetical protein LW807_03335 [Proteobacteria bacterium]|jgi:hypothetical protein|nr:hypothetical protein [Pseudomonadota bacterium]